MLDYYYYYYYLIFLTLDIIIIIIIIINIVKDMEKKLKRQSSVEQYTFPNHLRPTFKCKRVYRPAFKKVSIHCSRLIPCCLVAAGPRLHYTALQQASIGHHSLFSSPSNSF